MTKSAADRQREFRRRQLRGRRIARVEIDENLVVDRLIEQRLITEEDAKDFSNIERAIAELIEKIPLRVTHTP